MFPKKRACEVAESVKRERCNWSEFRDESPMLGGVCCGS